MKDISKKISFSSLFHSLADATLLVDDNGRIVIANDLAQKMLGFSIDEITKLKVEALIPKLYRQHHTHLRNDFFKNPEKRSMGNGRNLVVLTKSGQELNVDISLSPINSDKDILVLVTLNNVDKLFDVQSSLKASEERLRLAKASAGLGVFDISLVSKQVQYDEVVGKIFGFDRKIPVEYERFIEMIDINDQKEWREIVDNTMGLQQDIEFTLECRVNNRLKNDQRRVHVAGKVFFENGIPERMLGVMKDITENKLLQQKISKQRIELEILANTQVAIQTASAIAHEINQPLAAISAYSEVALYALKAERLDTDRLTRSLSGCVTEAQRAGNSLHELMEFLQKGKIEAIPLDLNKMVVEAINITRNHGYEDFQAILDLKPHLPKVLASKTQLQKVLVNLLRNGVEAVHTTGIPFAKIEVNVLTHADLNFAEVIIRDNGPGLSKEAVNRIFQPFFTTKPHGIGMGLAISRSLVEASGGKLWFDANSSEGATFHLTLPFADQ